MADNLSNELIASVTYYLNRIEHILTRVSKENTPQRYLDVKLADDMLDTGLNFAIAIKFAARTLCPPAALDAPEIPDTRNCNTLLAFLSKVKGIIAPITAENIVAPVTHIAGDAKLQQNPEEYVTKFAFPNMIFHLTIAYAGLRHSGFNIGKSDFDGLHVY